MVAKSQGDREAVTQRKINSNGNTRVTSVGAQDYNGPIRTLDMSDAAAAALSRTQGQTTLRLKIDGEWYDLTQWQHTHPGGAQILKHLHGEDATDAFHSLHSQEAKERLKKLPKVAPSAQTDVTPTKLDVNFRIFRQQLERDGYFTRNPLWDAFYIVLIFGMIAIGTMIASNHPIWAIALIGLAMEQAGWMGHDYGHGRGTAAWWLNAVSGGCINGFSSKWWSDKHNTHHVYPNTVGLDRDIANDPVFHLWIPEHKKDHPLRAYQHFYFFPVAALIYYSWRLQSAQDAWKRKDHFELALIVINYVWMFSLLPWYVILGSIYVGGLLVGPIVTATHQSEDFLPSEGRQYDYVRDQFLSTRNAATESNFVNWLWGGMQFQLEHHLFPMMPKYYYREVSKLVKKFAKENDIEYREDPVWDIMIRNIKTMRKFALASCPSAAN